MVICCECRKDTKYENLKGSFKHPFCKKCYKKLFNDEPIKYLEFLQETHAFV